MTMDLTPPRSPRRSHRLLAVGALAGCLTVGGSAWAVFTVADTSEASVSAGAVVLDWVSADATQLSLEVGPLRPGESTEHLVDLENQGTIVVTQMQLAYTGTDSALTDPSDGLQMTLEECSSPWEGSVEASTCPGTPTTLTSDRPVNGRTDLSTIAATTPGATSHLRFTFRLPDSSPATAQNATTTVDFTVLGNQRPGQHR